MYNERVAIVLGLITLTMALMVFLSCRTFAALLGRFGVKDLTKNRTYRVFNRYHVYYWWLFGIILLTHITMAIFHTGLPQAGDPDAWKHWLILSVGTTSSLSGLGVFFSCRVSPRLFSRIPRMTLSNGTYRSFFKSHSLYWLIFGLLVATHFIAGFLHAGIWPMPVT